ncbi:hypothetical protein [Olleya sp. HaHaR_3_96]|uniref:hypothetical protein n=1 Tax=Olleya sp. HaHaR_3_96 TaxID=2745560 RepID=UPI002119DA2C|nr:hypothetical protein [Olleya sp. HaHaR_3_96]
MDALQNIRIKHRWDAVNLENENIKLARFNNKAYKPQRFDNGDTKNNSYLDAGIYFTKLLLIGPKINIREAQYSSTNILISN